MIFAVYTGILACRYTVLVGIKVYISEIMAPFDVITVYRKVSGCYVRLQIEILNVS